MSDRFAQVRKNRYIMALERQFEENPVLIIGAFTGLALAAAKLVKVTTEHRNSRTWAREVERRRAKLVLR